MADREFPADLKYAESDEWVRVQGDEATIGITDFAQHELGDVVYLDLPWETTSGEMRAGERFGDIESVKATSPVFGPVTGSIVRVNEALKDHPEIINADPYGDGWMVVVKLADPAELDRLMDAAAYKAHTQTRGGH